MEGKMVVSKKIFLRLLYFSFEMRLENLSSLMRSILH